MFGRERIKKRKIVRRRANEDPVIKKNELDGWKIAENRKRNL